MEVFEKILLNYGGYILIRVRDIFERYELYERCAEINKVLEKYDISTSMSIEDWQTEIWRKGYSGEAARFNAPLYFMEAMTMCVKQGMFDGVEEGWNKVNKSLIS